MTEHDEYLPPLDHAGKVAYYKAMEQQGENLISHARKQLGWLALGGVQHTEEMGETVGGVHDL